MDVEWKGPAHLNPPPPMAQPIRLRAGATLVAACTLLSAAGAAAQEPAGASLEGQIVDSISGEPVAGVMVRTEAGGQAITDDRGRFRLTGLPEGLLLFALLSADCRITWAQVDLEAGEATRARLRLPPAFGAARAETRREEDRRRRSGGGRRVEADEIDRMGVRTATELIRRVAPGMVGPLGGEPGLTAEIRSSRSSSLLPEAPPVVVIDGVRTPNAAGALHDLQASDIAVLEVLPGAVAGWEFGSSGASGVIRITLRRGLATGASERPAAAECVVPAFPRG